MDKELEVNKEKLGINEWLELIKEDKNLTGAYISIAQYIYLLETELKKQKEVIDKIMNLIKQYGKYDGKKCTRGFQMWTADFNKLLEILEDKEV